MRGGRSRWSKLPDARPPLTREAALTHAQFTFYLITGNKCAAPVYSAARPP